VAQTRDAAPRCRRIPPMINRIPFADPSPDRDDQCGELNPPELLVIRPKATFQWPPDCVWPFIDRKSDSDT
jgi:hypothetical protein